MNNTVKEIIHKLGLESHVEGGYYKRTYQSPLQVNLGGKTRFINTAIYYLLQSGDFSCWHRIKSDEIWHYYCGSNLILHTIAENGTYTATRLGNMLENSDAVAQLVIPANTWFAADIETQNSFTLVGCTVSPGFDFEDFEIGKLNFLLQQFPQHEKILHSFIQN